MGLFETWTVVLVYMFACTVFGDGAECRWPGRLCCCGLICFARDGIGKRELGSVYSRVHRSGDPGMSKLLVMLRVHMGIEGRPGVYLVLGGPGVLHAPM